MDDRLLESCAKEIERQVADIFKAARNQPCVLCEIPIIGRVRGCDYSPHAPRQQTFFIERLVVKALLAREWFKLYEAPPWAGPLPLCEQEYSACFESGERRPLSGSMASTCADTTGSIATQRHSRCSAPRVCAADLRPIQAGLPLSLWKVSKSRSRLSLVSILSGL
jgi:hypothetical protein